ncbi:MULTISPECIES: zinc finger domain-containing protein [Streptomyces]|uniref:zinc finger domain-containing protein n=1 Tax=Streptomyces lycopersici TaxID=2974589 RepID=UPI0021D02E36|nr:hypothetical protein [Streptomyces sp. NEAU-383]
MTSRRPLRFPQMAIRCPWCRAAPGELCTNARGRRPRRADTHAARRIAWVVETTTCPVAACESAPGSPCRSSTTKLALATGVHPERDTAAERAVSGHREPP